MGSVGMWRLIGHRSVSAWSVFRRSFGTKQISALCGHIDRYNGIHVDVGAADVPTDNHFVAQLKGIDCVLYVCIFCRILLNTLLMLNFLHTLRNVVIVTSCECGMVIHYSCLSMSGCPVWAVNFRKRYLNLETSFLVYKYIIRFQYQGRGVKVKVIQA